MENIIIRNIKEKDIPSVVDIQINGWKSAYKGIIADSFLNSIDRDAKIKRMRKNYKDNGFIVAILNNEVVGFCRYIESNEFTTDMQNIDCELLALYVKPQLKYNGIGTKLFEFVTNEFRSNSKTKMILWCLKDNEPSKMFYTKMGGKIVKERVIEIGGNNYYEVGFEYTL